MAGLRDTAKDFLKNQTAILDEGSLAGTLFFEMC
jgi:hypothetical protein